MSCDTRTYEYDTVRTVRRPPLCPFARQFANCGHARHRTPRSALSRLIEWRHAPSLTRRPSRSRGQQERWAAQRAGTPGKLNLPWHVQPCRRTVHRGQ